MNAHIIGTVTIAASILCIGAVAAQPPVPPLNVEPRFKIEAVSVKAIDQAGVDWWGSDEVFAITKAAGVTMRTETLKGIKTGQTKAFASGKACILPIQTANIGDSECNNAGVRGPLSFNVRLFLVNFDWGALLGHFEPISTEPGSHDSLIG